LLLNCRGLMRGVKCNDAGRGGENIPAVPGYAPNSPAAWQVDVPISKDAPHQDSYTIVAAFRGGGIGETVFNRQKAKKNYITTQRNVRISLLCCDYGVASSHALFITLIQVLLSIPEISNRFAR
jgi:hypothetical protein